MNNVKVHYKYLELSFSADVCVTYNTHSWVVTYNMTKQSEIHAQIDLSHFSTARSGWVQFYG